MRERFASGLNDKAAKTSIEALNDNLSLVIDLSMSVKQAHWNMRGNNFIGVHELLDKANANLREILDTIAERAVILGGTPVGTSHYVAENTKLPAYPTDIELVKDHVKELTERYKMVAASLREAIDVTEDAGDADTADLFTEASRIVDKDAWFIGSNSEGN
ncbi:DNA starvation/stationary phase protection protein Dps [Falsirhodobacter sp. alg1]|uniref:DNA starvation/stationary phase protection protein Dps n=1 Tax=Falsirhodobacter sp. alg1 TaxID=1472418 RepID=UPI0005F00582|nr:DNA starvation/stationary phase protection protein Dps [Falsirhodobacter sp. alg1]